MVSDYMFSSPLVVGMTTHPALSLSLLQTGHLSGPGEGEGTESEGTPLTSFSSPPKGPGRDGEGAAVGKALWFWLPHEKSSLIWHTHCYCLEVVIFPQSLPWTELIPLATVEHDPG